MGRVSRQIVSLRDVASLVRSLRRLLRQMRIELQPRIYIGRNVNYVIIIVRCGPVRRAGSNGHHSIRLTTIINVISCSRLRMVLVKLYLLLRVYLYRLITITKGTRLNGIGFGTWTTRFLRDYFGITQLGPATYPVTLRACAISGPL